MFVQQTLLIDQMRNLIMTAEEWEEAESEAIDYTRINVGIMCGTMLDRRKDGIYETEARSEADCENSAIGFPLMRCPATARTRH